MDMMDWVLSAFHGRDLEEMRDAAEHAADAVECVVAEGLDRAMNLYN
jgi:PTH1 family peptidyl-tRNA hydrolase